MLHTILLIGVALWLAFLPVYLWGYAVSCLIDEPLNRRRFFIGMILGVISVILVFLLASVRQGFDMMGVIGFFFVLILVVLGVISLGQRISRSLLTRLVIINTLTIVLFGVIVLFVAKYIGTIPLVAILPLLLASFFEEASKHLMSIGLMSQDFRFSRRDIIIFTLFVVLGFVFAENILYFFGTPINMSTWIFRSLLTLVAHIFASLLCALVWWRALAYEPRSVQYIFVFLSGFVLATLVHLGYNAILEYGSILGLLGYMILGYIVFTRSILRA